VSPWKIKIPTKNMRVKPANATIIHPDYYLCMVAPKCFGITLPSSGSVPSAFWEMFNWGTVDRILWMGVLYLVTWCAVQIATSVFWSFQVEKKNFTLFNRAFWYTYLTRTNKIHGFRLKVLFNDSVFDMFEHLSLYPQKDLFLHTSISTVWWTACCAGLM
jgi:hypothetical protein